MSAESAYSLRVLFGIAPMELHRISRLTGPSEETGEAEYWITDVREYEDMLGFELLDHEMTVITQFLFADAIQAEVARGGMFAVLKNVVAIAPASLERQPEKVTD